MKQVKRAGDTLDGVGKRANSWTGRATFPEKRQRCTHGNENGKKLSGAN